jgi:hypothetical protein
MFSLFITAAYAAATAGTPGIGAPHLLKADGSNTVSEQLVSLM